MRPRTTAFLVEALVLVGWVGLMVHAHVRLTGRGGSDRETLALLETVTEGPGSEWMSVYLDGKKIGCGFSDRIKQRDGYRIQERMYLRLRAFQQSREVVTALVAETDEAHRLRRFDFMLTTEPSVIRVSGAVQGKILDLEVHSGGETRSEQIRLNEVPELSVTFKDRFLEQAPRVGDVLTFPYFDPATLSQRTLRVEVLRQGYAVVDGRRVRTYEIRSSYHGLESTAVVTEDGLTLEETNSLGMKLKRESREQALYGGWRDGEAPVDIVALTAVPVSRPITNPRHPLPARAAFRRRCGGPAGQTQGRPATGRGGDSYPGTRHVAFLPDSDGRSPL